MQYKESWRVHHAKKIREKNTLFAVSRDEGTAQVETDTEAKKERQRDENLPNCGPRSRGGTRLHCSESQT
ncbi:hypothetical protein CEXT_698631, partial [Caerostris extrusa]